MEDTGQSLPKLQGKIHVEKGDLEGVSDLLVERGICTWTPLDDVATYRGQPILNGLFGVKKSGVTADNKPVLRVIMNFNLVPSNSVMVQLQGNVRNLPSCQVLHPGCLACSRATTVSKFGSQICPTHSIFSGYLHHGKDFYLSMS